MFTSSLVPVNSSFFLYVQVFLVRKIVGRDANTLYAMKVLKKATLKGNLFLKCTFKVVQIF